MKLLFILGCLLFGTHSFAQGLIFAQTELKALRIISVASVDGEYLGALDNDGITIHKLDLPSMDLQAFNKKFASKLSGDDAIFCSVNLYKDPLFLKANELGVHSIRLCLDKNQKIVASGIDTFTDLKEIISEDLKLVQDKSKEEIQTFTYGDNSDRLVVEKDQSSGFSGSAKNSSSSKQ